jgi:hypothetical protein
MKGLLRGFVGLSVVLALTVCAAPARGQAGGAPAAPATQQSTSKSDAPALKASPTSEPVALDTPGGKLHGTLLVPAAGRAPYPVVLIIAGSGPTDRNGNSPMLPGANNSLRYLAEGLAAEGVASLRFDKRGVAESAMATKSESDLRFDTYIEDAVLWGQRLRADRRFSALVVAGHSEGSLVGAVAAQRLGADGFVSIAGAGRRIDVIILEQVKPQFTAEQYAKTEAALKSLAEGKTVPDVPANDILFRPSVQPYLISWLKYDPAAEVAKLKAPVLVAQGTHDIQARPEDAKALAAAKPGAKLLLVEGMNHVLKLTPADPKQQAASYSDPALPVAPKFLAEVVAFVKAIKK